MLKIMTDILSKVMTFISSILRLTQSQIDDESTSPDYSCRIMVALDIWHTFFSASTTPLERRQQQEIEILIRRLEEFAWRENGNKFFIELCITSSSLESLKPRFRTVAARKSFLRQVRVIPVPDNLTQDMLEGVNREYMVTRKANIPVFLTNLREYISILLSSSAQVYSPEELNTRFWLSDNLSLTPALVRRWLFPLLGISPSPKRKEDYEKEIYSCIDRSEPLTACTASVDLLLEVRQDSELSNSLANIDLILPAGMPVVRILQWMGASSMERVTGRSLFNDICEHYREGEQKRIYIISDNQKNLETIRKYFEEQKQSYPGIEFVGFDSPDTSNLMESIQGSNSDIVFVSLSPIFQERWIIAHGRELDTVVIGIGHLALSTFVDEVTVPKWIEESCLEWCWSLVYTPSEMWRHYLVVVPTFITLALKIQVCQVNRRFYPIALPQRSSIMNLLYHIAEFDARVLEVS